MQESIVNEGHALLLRFEAPR